MRSQIFRTLIFWCQLVPLWSHLASAHLVSLSQMAPWVSWRCLQGPCLLAQRPELSYLSSLSTLNPFLRASSMRKALRVVPILFSKMKRTKSRNLMSWDVVATEVPICLGLFFRGPRWTACSGSMGADWLTLPMPSRGVSCMRALMSSHPQTLKLGEASWVPPWWQLPANQFLCPLWSSWQKE